MMPTFDDEYRSGRYSGYYRPEHVVVLCSPGTFSAGFTLMRRLVQGGAIVVGTPSAQAGNCFGDIMNFTLKNSGLPGSVSRKYFEDFPDDPERGRLLKPDYVLPYRKLAECRFDSNAEIRYALEVLDALDKR